MDGHPRQNPAYRPATRSPAPAGLRIFRAPRNWGACRLTALRPMRARCGMQIGKPGEPVTHLSQAYPDRVEVRGRDLAGDLMGRLTFTEYFHLLLTGREPTDDERYFLDLLLVAIAEH